MKSYLIKSNGDAGQIRPKSKTFGLKELYKLINAELIEVVHINNDNIMIVDEEGRLKQRPLNYFASSICGQVIVGDVVVCHKSLLK